MENDDRCLDSASLCNRGGNPNPILGDGALQRGDRRKEEVKKLQRMLKELDYDLGNTGPEKDGVDGSFGKKTHDAVIEFQQDEAHKYWEGKTLNDDGLVGPRTSDALNREMVGVWYDFYQTDEKLTEGKKIITVTSNYLSDTGLSLEDLKAEEDIDVIIKGEIQKIRYGIDLTATDLYWLPDARNDRLEYTARIYGFLKDKWVFPPPRKRTITFELKDVSKEPGICMNYPQKGNTNPDLFFAEDNDKMKIFDLNDDNTSGESCPTEILVNNDNPAHSHHYLKATTKETVNEATVVVRCEDYGAYGTLQASAPNCETLFPREKNAQVSGKTGPNDVKMPYDDDGNNIADVALQDDNGAPADTDDDATPTGNPSYPGDGLTNYEEYRGFIIGGGTNAKKHIRTNITQKDLFIYIEHAELSAHLGYFNQSGLRVHILRDPLLFNGTDNKLINFNRNYATKGEQHGLWLRTENKGKGRGVTFWITRPPRKPGNCRKIEIRVEKIKDEGLPNMLKRVIAHELGHAVGLAHHGDGGNHTCNGHKYWNRNGLETSGNVNCVMRYTNWANGWCHGDPHHRHVNENPAVVGNTFCSTPDATGINAPGIFHFKNDATVGNCKGQIRVRDRD